MTTDKYLSQISRIDHAIANKLEEIKYGNIYIHIPERGGCAIIRQPRQNGERGIKDC